jgi:conjugative transfer signal peptidase TraF
MNAGVRRCVAVSCLGFAALVLLWALGVRINRSDSVPIGLWHEEALPGELAPGMVVAVCPPAAPIFEMARARHYLSEGWCASKLEVMFKPLAAVAGDVVEVDSRGVSVNGGLLLRSAPLEQDAAGRPLTAVPAGVYSVPPGYVWMISSYSPRSFDSRYFGPLPVAQLRGRVQPLWLWRHD